MPVPSSIQTTDASSSAASSNGGGSTSSAIVSMIPQLKMFVDSGLPASTVVKALKDFDSTNRLGRALEALDYLHIRVALDSSFVEILCPLLNDLAQCFENSEYWSHLHSKLKAEVDAFAAGLLSASLEKSHNEIYKFIKKEEVKKDVSETEEKAAPTKEEQDEEEDEEDEWITLVDPEKQKRMTREQLDMQAKKVKLKRDKLNYRYSTFRKWVTCFSKQFSPEALQKKVRSNDETLFATSVAENPLVASMLSCADEHFSTRKDGCEHLYAPTTMKEAWEDIVAMDNETEESLIAKGVDKKDIPPETFLRVRIFRNLNNLLLLSELETSVPDSKITEVLQYCCRLFNEFMAGKVDKIGDIQDLILAEIARVVPSLSHSVGRIGDFLLEAVFQNISQFKSAFENVRKLIPAPLYEAARGYGYDVDNINVDEVITTKIRQIAALRTRKENGEGEVLITTENVTFIAKSILPGAAKAVETGKETVAEPSIVEIKK